MKIIKTATCKSSSGQSTLTYNIGMAGSDIQFQITENTGTGFFSKEWVSLKDIQEVITKEPFTSTVLHSLFNGKSINTPGFMLAVLLNEGLVKRSKRCYERADPSAFMESLADKRSPAKKASRPKIAATKSTKEAP